MVHQPHGHFRYASGKFLHFDAVELIDCHARQQRGIDLLVAILRLQALQFQPSDFAIRDDKEVAAAASWIEEIEAGELFLKLRQFPVASGLASNDAG
jgi:hypothetical protein